MQPAGAGDPGRAGAPTGGEAGRPAGTRPPPRTDPSARGSRAEASHPEGTDRAESTSIGQYLAGQRRLRGMTREDLAARTRIPLRSIERLEAGAFDDMHDGFVRGFVRTVAVGMGLDADDAVARMLPEAVVSRAAREPLAAPRRAPLAGILLVLGFAVVVVSWFLWTPRPPTDPVEARLVYRRDAVRELVEQPRAEPLVSATVRDEAR